MGREEVNSAGFARHDSGLFVPDEHKRKREVWCRDQWKHVERATKFLESRGVEMFFRCPEATCGDKPIERIRNLDGGLTFRCNHLDRVIPKELR